MWNWVGTPITQNIVLFLAFAVNVATLVYLIKYVRATKGIEREAGIQSEGLSKPALALRAVVPRSLTTDENFLEILNRKLLTRAEPNAKGFLEMVNIGSGPALLVQYEIREGSPQSGKPWIGGAAYIRAGETLALPLQSGNPIKDRQQKITCSYASLSGNKYESVIDLYGDEIQNSAFTRIGGA